MTQLPRAEVRALLNTCPRCGAPPHNPCRHATAYRHEQTLKHPHRERHFRSAKPDQFVITLSCGHTMKVEGAAFTAFCDACGHVQSVTDSQQKQKG